MGVAQLHPILLIALSQLQVWFPTVLVPSSLSTTAFAIATDSWQEPAPTQSCLSLMRNHVWASKLVKICLIVSTPSWHTRHCGSVPFFNITAWYWQESIIYYGLLVPVGVENPILCLHNQCFCLCSYPSVGKPGLAPFIVYSQCQTVLVVYTPHG